MSRIKLNAFNQVEEPTIILATRSGEKIGAIPAYNVVFRDTFTSGAELFFAVNKYDNGVECKLWKDIKDFRLVYCREWDLWFEINVEVDERNDVKKNVTCKTLAEAELSQVNLYNIEINTEKDIERDEYTEPTVLLNESNTKASLLHRITEKIPHYTIAKVDSTIASIQKTFTFDNISIYDAFQKIAEEIGCIFILSSTSVNGLPSREIYVHDLQSNCNKCNHRGEFTDVCPECEETDITEPYGTDTTVFISSDTLAEDIQFETDSGAVKNCFKLEAGDDLINATIRSCNPNGTDYIWYFSDDMKEDMSDKLTSKIESYDELYRNYQSSEPIEGFEGNVFKPSVGSYNNLVKTYDKNDSEYIINSPITGYGNLMTAYYNAIDFEIYLQSGMLPGVDTSDTTATKEAGKLASLKTIPLPDREVKALSKTIADNLVIATAKTMVDINYDVEIVEIDGESRYDETNSTWTGKLVVSAYNITEEEKENKNEDKIKEVDLSITFIDASTDTDSLSTYIEQEVKKALTENAKDEFSIEGLFNLEKDKGWFEGQLSKYSLDALTAIYYACQAALNIMIENGVNNTSSGVKYDSGLTKVFDDYYHRFNYIQEEIKTREADIATVVSLQDEINDKRIYVQDELNFEKYIGSELWTEFCSFRREDKYSNTNYISDGLNNAELISKAQEFIKVASDEIYKSAELQHKISSTLKNLLAMPEFEPLAKHFDVGNWLRIKVDDSVYKLRLLEYEVDFEDIDNINVEFSDVMKVSNGVSDIKSILDKASSMATSYDTVKRQASQGAESKEQVNTWVNDGLDLTTTKIVNNADNQEVTWDDNGILLREHFPISDTYSDEQVKIINNGLYVTTDNWKSSKAAIGSFMYPDPQDGNPEDGYKIKQAYGVIADTIVGNLILGKELGIYNESNSFEVTENGLIISNKDKEGITNPVTIKMNPNDGNIFDISKKTEKGTDKIFTVDKNGNASINNIIMGGNITWDTSSNPVKVLYAQKSISKPVDYNPENANNGYKQYEEYGESSDSTWHRKLGENDKFASYSYDDGKTWSEKVLIRGKDGVDGNDANVPGYIETTYIDFTKVLSPEVRGNFILGGSIIGGEFVATDSLDNTSISGKVVINSDGFACYNQNEQLHGLVCHPTYDDLTFDDGISVYSQDSKIFGISRTLNSVTTSFYGFDGVEFKQFGSFNASASVGKLLVGGDWKFDTKSTVDFSEAKVTGLKITFG